MIDNVDKRTINGSQWWQFSEVERTICSLRSKETTPHQTHPLSQYRIQTTYLVLWKEVFQIECVLGIEGRFFSKIRHPIHCFLLKELLMGLSSILMVWRRKICSEACFETRYKRNGSNFRAQTTVIYHYFVIGFVPVPPCPLTYTTP